MKNTYVAIMAGGIGSRFWPSSRAAYPKQFLDILNVGRSLIQMTVDRFVPLVGIENIFIVTNDQYADLVQEQLPDLSPNQILREPSRKNTAPCIAYVCKKIQSINPNANIIVSPADHLVLQETKFHDTLKQGIDFVHRNDVLLTLGITPSRPDTGYGYIQYRERSQDKGIHPVKTFTEKPDIELARAFIDSGDFVWNSGMFLWNVNTILEAFSSHLPEIHEAFDFSASVFGSAEEEKVIKKAYSYCTNISIDYGIMEKSENVYVLPADFGWSDVGTWKSLYEVKEKDYLGNAVNGKNVKIYNAANNMVVAKDEKLVVIQGLTNYCVIDTDDVLLIWEKNKEQDIKRITTDIKLEKRDKFL